MKIPYFVTRFSFSPNDDLTSQVNWSQVTFAVSAAQTRLCRRNSKVRRCSPQAVPQLSLLSCARTADLIPRNPWVVQPGCAGHAE